MTSSPGDKTFTSKHSSADSCADEPIHIPGSVQAHGFFLLIDVEANSVAVASENAEAFLNLPLKLILGAGLDALFDREVLASLKTVDDSVAPANGVTYLGTFRVRGEMFSVMTHMIDERRALEFERVEKLVSPELMNAVITNFVATLGQVSSQRALCDAVVQQVQQLTGYDRVLLYSFDEEGHGTVLSESNNGKLPSYLGLRFPGSDIPAQARALYVRNTMRIIPDADYVPSPLVSKAGSDAGAPVDLSLSILRSVSPVHLEYMHNMGTLSSMSVSVLVDGKLWGLISGHHAEAKNVAYLIRSACDMLAKMASTQLLALRTSARLAETLRFHAVQRQLLTHLAVEPNYMVSLRDHMDELMSVANASGVALLIDGSVHVHGTVPDSDAIGRLSDWLDEAGEMEIFSSHELERLIPWTAAIRQVASGLLAVRISSVRRRYLLWFRPEIVETVQWAGVPSMKTEGDSLHPRASFESWKDVVRGRSESWTEFEIESALDFRSSLTTIGLQYAEEAVELGEARFQQLTAALPAKIFTADDDGQLTYVNKSWHSQGLSATGYWFKDAALIPEDAERCATIWKKAVAEDKTFEAEVRLQNVADRPVSWNLVRAVPFHREGAARAGWIGTFIDLTDAKEREQALRVNEKLALTGRMTSVIAHEINNPLESITNLMYLLRTELPEQGPASTYITMAESELDRISGITKQTLRWSRESPDRAELFTAGSIIDDVLRLFAGKIRNRSLNVTIAGDRDTRLYGVVGKIRQVLANLVTNAVDAAPLNGSMRIDVLSVPERSGFSVTDNGGGISEADQARLFEPFYSTKGDLGNGLGLYISKEIVERHGGNIAMRSEVGHGTTMTVLLPAT